MLISDYRRPLSPNVLVEGYAQWMDQMESDGAKLYYVNFMFEQLGGPRYEVVHKMKHLIERFYAQYVTQFSHHPLATGEQEGLPQFWLFPDLPGKKKLRSKIINVAVNDGLHFNGAMVIRKPLRWETKIRGIKRHLLNNQSSYARDGIERIHVKRIKRDRARLTDYALKTVKANECDENDILILPKTRGEKMQYLPQDARNFKGLMSAYNLSPETAAAFLKAAAVSAH